MEKKRLTFKCWNCDREYALTREIQGQPKLFVACPYCEKAAVVDLAPYRSPVVDIFKSIDMPKSNAEETLTLPAVIPTTAPPPEEK